MQSWVAGLQARSEVNRQKAKLGMALVPGEAFPSVAACRWWCGEGESMWSDNYRLYHNVYLTKDWIKMCEELVSGSVAYLAASISTCLSLSLSSTPLPLSQVLIFHLSSVVGLVLLSPSLISSSPLVQQLRATCRRPALHDFRLLFFRLGRENQHRKRSSYTKNLAKCCFKTGGVGQLKEQALLLLRCPSLVVS